ncbi:hypothetical protein CAPTEDRAFT_175726 [Capitella teleta]|uniref:Transmembrane protein 126A n=1 Tax=Capitella teleta TaxID=283909 RepID=R7T661_CAPTE|nr:hypothetical protein CAPTEDRAFT_175726 [Capitella teleta]|eukprot:ELT88723.1 hypothetical protein CAPTEDRAFT_175726 [Capitella teleta]
MGNAEGSMGEASYSIPREGIVKAPVNDIPKGAIRVPEEEVFKIQDRIMRKWKPAFEMHGLRYGSGYLGGMTAITGFYIHNYWRFALKLRQKNVMLTFLPTIVIPSVLATICNQNFVQKPMQLQQVNCYLCLEMRATTLQGFLGLFQPLVLGAIASTYAAKVARTYAVPPLGQPADLMHMYRELGGKLRTPLLVILLLQTAVVAKVTYEQEKGSMRLNNRLSTVMSSN